MKFLLDTNIVSQLVRDPHGVVARRIADAGESNVFTSIVVAAELRYGASKKASARLSAQIEAILGALAVLPLEPPADRHYGTLRADLQRKGQLIGPNDLLIAAHALSLGSILVTDNGGEFSRVPNLGVENWLA